MPLQSCMQSCVESQLYCHSVLHVCVALLGLGGHKSILVQSAQIIKSKQVLLPVTSTLLTALATSFVWLEMPPEDAALLP